MTIYNVQSNKHLGWCFTAHAAGLLSSYSETAWLSPGGESSEVNAGSSAKRMWECGNVAKSMA